MVPAEADRVLPVDIHLKNVDRTLAQANSRLIFLDGNTIVIGVLNVFESDCVRYGYAVGRGCGGNDGLGQHTNHHDCRKKTAQSPLQAASLLIRFLHVVPPCCNEYFFPGHWAGTV